MSFTLNGIAYQLQGANSTSVKLITDNTMTKLLQHNPTITYAIQIQEHQMDSTESATQDVMVKNSKLTKLLLEFGYLFEESKTLPPQTVNNHRIPLIKGSKPVNIRPYKHSPLHKTVIENMIQKLLQKGIIQPSVSPFFLSYNSS